LNGRDFSRIYKIEITFLVDIVALAGFLSNPAFSARILLLAPLIISGTLASMSAALFNNLYDMDIDANMNRTSYRSRIVNDKTYKRMFFNGTAMIAVAMLLSIFTINLLTAIFIFMGFLSYTLLYTILLKRRTTWNIVIGGIAGSFPALAGWAAVSNAVSMTAIFIALLVFAWTPTHFWALATNNTEDYKKAGVPMLPSVVGIERTSWIILANSVVLFVYSLLPLFFHQINVGIVYYVLAIVLGIVMLYYSIIPIIRNFSMSDFKRAFHYSNYYLLILLVSICLVNFIH
jgi:protoheme IX farnesyltransferase